MDSSTVLSTMAQDECVRRMSACRAKTGRYVMVHVDPRDDERTPTREYDDSAEVIRAWHAMLPAQQEVTQIFDATGIEYKVEAEYPHGDSTGGAVTFILQMADA